MSHILGLKFSDYGQIYYFESGAFVVPVGGRVIVQTEQGMGLGTVVTVSEERPEGMEEEELKPIFRLATEEDLATEKENLELAREAFRFCRQCISERKLEMKLVDVEVFFDHSKMVFFFTAPGRIDFRELVKDLVKNYRTRIELRQIGVRHETQMLGAVGNCGQVACCRRFMRKFAPVTIKMAKEQNLFLNPTKISGICGRLLCCLSFEEENYREFYRRCPKIGKRMDTDKGLMKVLRANFFRGTITVYAEFGGELEFTLEEWHELNPRRFDPNVQRPEPPQQQPPRKSGRPPRPPKGRPEPPAKKRSVDEFVEAQAEEPESAPPTEQAVPPAPEQTETAPEVPDGDTQGEGKGGPKGGRPRRSGRKRPSASGKAAPGGRKGGPSRPPRRRRKRKPKGQGQGPAKKSE